MVVLFLTTRTLTFQCLLLNRSLTKTEKFNLQVSYQKPLQKLLPRRVVEVKKIKKAWVLSKFPAGKETSLHKGFVHDSLVLLPLLASCLTGRLHLLHKIVVGTSIQYVLWINRE